MTDNVKKTLGKAIDEIIAALEPLDELTRTTAVRAACEHLGVTGALSGGSSTSSAMQVAESENHVSAAAPKPPVTDIRTLKNQKQPTSVTEMACIVAYYLDSL